MTQQSMHSQQNNVKLFESDDWTQYCTEVIVEVLSNTTGHQSQEEGRHY